MKPKAVLFYATYYDDDGKIAKWFVHKKDAVLWLKSQAHEGKVEEISCDLTASGVAHILNVYGD